MAILKRTLALFLISALAVSAWAERVSQDDAATVANNFMNAGTSQSGAMKAPAKRMVLKKAAQAEESQFYVYENADGEGWVMVAANDIAHPIIAYSDEGQFRFDNQPSNLKCWLGKYNKQIKQAEENGVSATEEVQQEWRKLRKGMGIKKGTPVVAALIKTKWDQTAPYYNQCPTKGSTRTLTGCVATAMAQVMNYWQWPKTGTGSYSYSTQMLALSCSADFGSTTYDWDNMLDKYTEYYNEGSSTPISTSYGTTAQKNAVATLMYHCGVAVAMDYNISSAGGSGAQTIRPNASYTTSKCAQNALYQNFGYKSTTVKGYYRPGGYGYAEVNDATWHNYLKTELDAARPIMYAGGGYEDPSDEDTYYGHSFICDGYDNTTPTRKYHFNWGWSGYCDGYYDIDNLVPGTGGSGAGQGEYLYDHDIIIGIIPDKPDVTITWSVQGITSTTTQTSGTLVLPTTTPSDCSGAGGKKFVGWTANSTITGGARPSDLFTSGSGITVTENKTYYAVYATASAGGGGASIVTLNASSDTSFPKDGITLTTSNGVLNNGTDYRIYKGATLTITSSVGDMSSIAFTFDGSYNGGGWATSYTPNSSTWTSPACTSGSSGKQARITQIIVTMAGGGTSYSDYSLTCGAPCSNTPVMSFTNATINKTTADASYTQAVTISGKGSGQTVVYSSSDETIATVNNSGVVTLKGEVGSTIITASVEANGTYCAASASYTLNVTAAPINVTLYYNNTSATLNDQPTPYTLPTGAPYNADMCEGDWTFAGWYGSTYTKSETEPSYISQLTATGSAYAIYTTTETSGSGGSTNITLNANTDTSFPKDGITLTTSNGVLNNGTDYRIYKGATLTITSSVGNMSSIAFTFDGSYDGGGWETSYTPNSSTWTSPACTSGSSGKQARITQIIVTVAGGGSSTTYYATTPDCSTPTAYTVTWKACGEIFHTQGFADGAALVLPASNPADNAGKTFVGWTATEHHTGASAPADLFNTAGSKTVTADVTYYAVFH